jgi:hypothetical protein
MAMAHDIRRVPCSLLNGYYTARLTPTILHGKSSEKIPGLRRPILGSAPLFGLIASTETRNVARDYLLDPMQSSDQWQFKIGYACLYWVGQPRHIFHTETQIQVCLWD